MACSHLYKESAVPNGKDVESLMGHSVGDGKKAMLINQLIQCGSLFETGFIVTDSTAGNDSIVFVNNSFTTITGYSLEEVRGKNLQFLHGEDTDMKKIRDINRKLREGKAVNEEVLHYKKDGSPFWSELVIQPILGETGEVLFINSFILDITERKINESLLQQHKQIFTGINESAGMSKTLQNICNFMKNFFSEEVTCAYIFKDSKEDWVMQKASGLPESLALRIEVGIALDKDYIKGNTLFVNEVPPNQAHDYVNSWSFPVFDQDGQLREVFLIYVKELKSPTDVQIQYIKGLIPVVQMIKTFFEQQNRLRLLAYSDLATGLPNRHGVLEKIKEITSRGRDYFVVVIEPNEYTNIVDLYGRDVVDDLFLQLARRIEKNKTDNYVGRISSSSLICTSEKQNSEAREFVVELRRITAEPFMVAGEEMFITLKIGISLADGESCAEEMLRRADSALTAAKGRPGGTVSFYKDLQNEETIKEMAIMTELMKVLSSDGIGVHLQPKVDLLTSEIIGFEALARWKSPVLGEVPPNTFIRIAENVGKIIDLELVILTKVLKWQRERISAGKKLYQIAVNISVDHFFHPSFVLVLRNLIAKYEVPPKYVRLEMTESIGLVDFKRAKIVFEKLNALGFEVSIDDFGVGYSSLSYLPQLQVSELKIDRSFISALDKQDTYAVVMTIIQLAKNLNLVTVAEGIEEPHQIEALVSLGCQIGQGFYYYKPMSFAEVELLLG